MPLHEASVTRMGRDRRPKAERGSGVRPMFSRAIGRAIPAGTAGDGPKNLSELNSFMSRKRQFVGVLRKCYARVERFSPKAVIAAIAVGPATPAPRIDEISS